MGIIIDLYPAHPRRMYIARPRLVATERPRAPRRRTASVAADAPLDCLSGGALAARFHAWHGASGHRYVCSVYGVDRTDPAAGLPDLDDAVVIAVALDPRDARSCVGIFEFCMKDGGRDRASHAVERALAAGAREWHVHLLATSPEARRAVIRDLEMGGGEFR
jgi:hypothetical protein